MTAAPQIELPLFRVRPGSDNVEFLVELLRGQDWLTSCELCQKLQWNFTESNRRRFRSIADASGGRIAGGQRGYKLVREMTGEEYQHFRNWMKSQADHMTARIIEADHIFYSRQPVEAGA